MSEEQEVTSELTEKPKEEILDSSTLVTINQAKQNKTLEELIQEDDLDKVKDLTHLFNVYQTKRNAIRMNALNDVQDALVKQMLERLQKYPDNFANKDIADWMKTIQTVMESNAEKVEKLDDIPAITYQQNNQVNLTLVDGLSKESREKVLGVVEALLKNVQSTTDSTVYDNEELEETSDTPSDETTNK